MLYSYRVCSARLSAVPTKTIKPLRPFFFLREKRNKKTRPLPPQQRGFCFPARLKISKGQVVFFEKIAQKISTFNPCQFLFCPFCLAYRKPDSAKIKFLLSFGFLV